MSLDITLVATQPVTVAEFNITHNMIPMAEAAGLYEIIWQPQRLNIVTGKDMIGPLIDGLSRMRENKESLLELNPENGWGDYDMFMKALDGLLTACFEHPQATINTCR